MTLPDNAAPRAALPAPRSTFVTVIAWFGIVSGCMATLGGVVLMAAGPAGIRSGGILASGVMGLAAALGLRRRRHWARLSFIGVQALTIAQSLITVVSSQSRMMEQLIASGLPAEEARSLAATARNTSLVFALVFAVINGLIIAKLCSPEVRQEFDEAEGLGS